MKEDLRRLMTAVQGRLNELASITFKTNEAVIQLLLKVDTLEKRIKELESTAPTAGGTSAPIPTLEQVAEKHNVPVEKLKSKKAAITATGSKKTEEATKPDHATNAGEVKKSTKKTSKSSLVSTST